MIQVLERAFAALDILSEKEASLGMLAETLGIRTSTMHNILSSLIELEVVEQVRRGQYALGPRLPAMVRHQMQEGELGKIAQSYTERLSRETREASVVCTTHLGKRFKIAVSQGDHSVIINPSALSNTSMYENATGRLMLAYYGKDELKAFVAEHGLPDEDWPEIKTLADLEQTLDQIRENKLVVHRRGQTQELSVPIMGPDGTVWAALGVPIPVIRMNDETRKSVLEHMRAAANDMQAELEVAFGIHPEAAE